MPDTFEFFAGKPYDRHEFAGMPYEHQPSTTWPLGHVPPSVPDGKTYVSLPPAKPHATYTVVPTPLAGFIHPNSYLRDVQRVLMKRTKAARAASHEIADQDSPAAAALRGKAIGYKEAADLIESVLRGGRLRRKWWPGRG